MTDPDYTYGEDWSFDETSRWLVNNETGERLPRYTIADLSAPPTPAEVELVLISYGVELRLQRTLWVRLRKELSQKRPYFQLDWDKAYKAAKAANPKGSIAELQGDTRLALGAAWIEISELEERIKTGEKAIEITVRELEGLRTIAVQVRAYQDPTGRQSNNQPRFTPQHRQDRRAHEAA